MNIERIQPSRQHSNPNNSSKGGPSHHHSPNDATEVADVVSRYTYGDDGREDYVPHDGTSLTRLAEWRGKSRRWKIV